MPCWAWRRRSSRTSRSTYADTATMPRPPVFGSRRQVGVRLPTVLDPSWSRHSFRVEGSLNPGAPCSREGGECDVGYAKKGRSAGTAGRGLPGLVDAAGLYAGNCPKHAQRLGPGAVSYTHL